MTDDQVRQKKEEIERIWKDSLVIIIRENTLIHNVRFQTLPEGDKDLVNRIKKYGIDRSPGKRPGWSYKITSGPKRKGRTGTAGYVKLTGYPGTGTVEFTFTCLNEDATFFLFDVLAQKLHYSVKEAIQKLNKWQLTSLELENQIISDPYNNLPLGAKVKNEFSELESLPSETTNHIINGSEWKKDNCYAGSGPIEVSVPNMDPPGSGVKTIRYPGSTIMMWLANLKTAEFVQAFREEIDATRGIGKGVDILSDQIGQLKDKIEKGLENVGTDIADHTKREKTLNKDLTEILVRIDPDLSSRIENIDQTTQEVLLSTDLSELIEQGRQLKFQEEIYFTSILHELKENGKRSIQMADSQDRIANSLEALVELEQEKAIIEANRVTFTYKNRILSILQRLNQWIHRKMNWGRIP